MGMTIKATLCMGIVVYDPESDLNYDFFSKIEEEFVERDEEFSIEEYLDKQYKNIPFEIVTTSPISDNTKIIIALRDTIIETEDIYSLDRPYLNKIIKCKRHRERLALLGQELLSEGLELGESGVLLTYYYSH